MHLKKEILNLGRKTLGDGNLFKLIESLLDNRDQGVVLNIQSSDWKLITAGLPFRRVGL